MKRTIGTIALVTVVAVAYGGLAAGITSAATSPTPKPKVVRGPAGAPGPEGKPGPQGERGAPGRDGRDGNPGAMGPQGVPGQNGRDGTDGTNGRDGLGFTSGVVLLISGTCPAGTTLQGNANQWRVYAGNPFTGVGSELYVSACAVN